MSEMSSDEVLEARMHSGLVFLSRKSKSSCLILRFSMIASMTRSAPSIALVLALAPLPEEMSHRSVNVWMLLRT